MANRPIATSIPIDPDKFHAALARHHLTQAAAGQYVGCGISWGASVIRRRRANYQSLVSLALALGYDTEALIAQISPEVTTCSPPER